MFLTDSFLIVLKLKIYTNDPDNSGLSSTVSNSVGFYFFG